MKPVASKPSAGPSASVMPTYNRFDLVFERGEGSWLVTTKGERFLDFASGVAVNALGHAHPVLVAALTEQAGKLWHTSNLYRVAGQERLAERLCAATFAERVFFCNSGAEACEGAIKAARRTQFKRGKAHKNQIITFDGAFHGRTLATIAAGGNETYLEGFEPRMPGFHVLPFGDLAALEQAVDDSTAAIMIEPLQGEGGIRVASDAYLKAIRALADKHGALVVFDEVQSGVGRTGRLFAHESSGVTPDIMAIAKGIGGGFPVGAFLTTEEAGQAMGAGSHGSTFGGNPLAMAVGNAVLDVILAPGFLAEVQSKGLYLKQKFAQLKDEFPGVVVDLRGEGLLQGMRVVPPAGDIVKALIGQKLLAMSARDNVLRVAPPLTVSTAEIDDAVNRIAHAFRSLPKTAG